MLTLKIIRIAVQILFIVFLPYLVFIAFDGIRAIYIAIIQNSFDFRLLYPKIISVLAIVPFTILFGRFFCGWICTFGALSDMIYALSDKLFKIKSKFKISEKVHYYLKFLKYFVLAYCVLIIWTLDIKFLDILSPWNAFGQLPDVNSAFSLFLVGSIVLILYFISSLFIERVFCRYLCPLGAFFSLVSFLKIFKIKKPTDKCGKCRICTNSCPMAIPLYKKEMVKSIECIECMNCTQACPRNNVTKIKDINPLIAALIAVSSMTGLRCGLDSAKNLSYFTDYKIAASSSTSGTSSTSGSASANPQNNQSSNYNDGTYTGDATGFRPGLNVAVTIKNGLISDISIGSNNESQGYKEQSFGIIPQEIIAAQSTTGIDVVSGATYTSTGLINAVKKALLKAAKK